MKEANVSTEVEWRDVTPGGGEAGRPMTEVVLLEVTTPHLKYLLWSNKHGMWWRPYSMGYTRDIDKAGRYGEVEAMEKVRNSAMCGVLEQVTCMVAAPDNWTER